GVVYVYTENGEFLGEGALVFEANEPDYTIPHKRIYLSRMVVKHSERGRGIGGILLDYLCDIAREMGYSEMTLGVDTDNHAARRLYEKKGFTTLLYQGVDQYGEYVKLLKRLTAARE
ncbi:MAG: GNAT family N-acetyltransferase, partial [Oscillospiraceae bacterium]|nr:GNAT family N-acetyltransferase [Oscillospiraceae bacterium]